MADAVSNLGIYRRSVEETKRRERIQGLLDQVKNEITVGILAGELSESTAYEFVVPQSRAVPGGTVFCRFMTRPMLDYGLAAASIGPSGFYAYDD